DRPDGRIAVQGAYRIADLLPEAIVDRVEGVRPVERENAGRALLPQPDGLVIAGARHSASLLLSDLPYSASMPPASGDTRHRVTAAERVSPHLWYPPAEV